MQAKTELEARLAAGSYGKMDEWIATLKDLGVRWACWALPGAPPPLRHRLQPSHSPPFYPTALNPLPPSPSVPQVKQRNVNTLFANVEKAKKALDAAEQARKGAHWFALWCASWQGPPGDTDLT